MSKTDIEKDFLVFLSGFPSLDSDDIEIINREILTVFEQLQEDNRELREGLEEALQFIQETRCAPKSFDEKTTAIRRFQKILNKEQ